MRKHLLALALVATVGMTFTGCGNSDKKEADATTTEAAKEQEVMEKYQSKVPKFSSSDKDTAQLDDVKKGETIVEMKVKKYGTMKFKFFANKAPLAVKNFLTLANAGYYDGLKFHRVINDFMIQSGDPQGTGSGGESIWGAGFVNETDNDLLPLRGSLCMANAGADTNGSQFFVVQAKADTAKKTIEEGQLSLTDEQLKAFEEQGGYPSLMGSYTVFGQMIDGYNVLDKIAAAEVEDNGGGEASSPKTDVVIDKVSVTTAK